MSIILLTLPLITILIIWFSPITDETAKHSLFKKTLIATLLNLFHSLLMLHFYDPNVTNFQFKLVIGNQLIGGIDGISLWLIILVNLIIPIVILNSWKIIEDIKLFKNFLILILFVNFWSNAVFFVLDLLLFYISFEAILIPVYYLIGYYGSRNKRIETAQNKFFIYTLIGSLFLLLAIITLYIETGTTDYQILLTIPISNTYQIWLWLGFFIAFAIKTPMWPFHIWLPLAHGESSTGTSVILAAILLKLGTYGFLRYILP
jgi:NADH:ubiquinone oxidoreductase subunit 4 (subunit M)